MTIASNALAAKLPVVLCPDCGRFVASLGERVALHCRGDKHCDGSRKELATAVSEAAKRWRS